MTVSLDALDRRVDERLTGAFGEPRDVRLYRRMRFIRRFEETLLGLFEEGLLTGTTHACIGQEAESLPRRSEHFRVDLAIRLLAVAVAGDRLLVDQGFHLADEGGKLVQDVRQGVMPRDDLR